MRRRGLVVALLPGLLLLWLLGWCLYVVGQDKPRSKRRRVDVVLEMDKFERNEILVMK